MIQVADILLLETKTTDRDIIIFLRQLSPISGPIRYGGIELAQNGFEPVAQVAQW